MKYWVLIFSIAIASSCGQINKDKKNTTNEFFDINGLVDYQVKMLDSIGPFLLKGAIINGSEEQKKIDTNFDFSWEKELSIFKSADINKPVLKDSYKIINETNSGSKNILYLSKSPNKTRVDSIVINYAGQVNEPIKILAFLSGNNVLFESSKTLELTFEKIGRHLLLSKYQIEGWQKMISKDTTKFSIKGELNF